MVQLLWSNYPGLTIIPLSWHHCLAIIHSPLLRSRFRIPLRTCSWLLGRVCELSTGSPGLSCEACDRSRTAKITKLSLTLGNLSVVKIYIIRHKPGPVTKNVTPRPSGWESHPHSSGLLDQCSTTELQKSLLTTWAPTTWALTTWALKWIN